MTHATNARTWKPGSVILQFMERSVQLYNHTTTYYMINIITVK